MKIPKKQILHLLEMRRKAGEQVMKYDVELHDKLLKYGVDINDIECGLDSVFLITEPRVCENEVRRYIEERLNSELKERPKCPIN